MMTIAEIFKFFGILDGSGRHIWGTDRETNHRYGDAYESLFPNRLAVELMMEVGVADGSSILAWRHIFPNALCVGLDIHPASTLEKNPVDRVEFHLGDATDQERCERVANGRQFDLIVDDASHQPKDFLATLFFLWPSVRPGGLYVIEDLNRFGINFRELFPFAVFVDTVGPFGGVEPLVIFRKQT